MIDNIITRISTIDFNILLFLGFILFLGALGGRLLQKIKFPQVVGYIIIGIILGQTGIRLIGDNLLDKMHPVSNFALGIIGFMIGSELKGKTIKKYGKQFSVILVLESLSAFFIVGVFVTLAAYLLFGDIKIAVSLGILLGSISSATAPAATTDVLWENKTKGPLTTMVLGLVAMDDGVALLLFAIASSIASVLLGTGKAGASNAGMEILNLLYETGGALVLGSLSGFGLSKLIRSFLDDDRILVFSLSSLLLLIGISQVLGLNMILATMSMGFFISNFAPRKSLDTFKLIQKFSPPIYILFFVLVGAELNISNVTLISLTITIVYLVGRVSGKLIGAFLGAKISKAPAAVKKYLGFCLMSQAGVAIGLSIVAEKTFSGSVGDLIILIITTTTFVVQLAGPPLVKMAVTKSGEAGLNKTEDDLLMAITAADLNKSEPLTFRTGTRLTEALYAFSENDNHYYAVLDDNEKVAGLVSLDNIKSLLMNESLSEFLVVLDIMEPVIRTCNSDVPAIAVRDEMTKYKLPCVPVTDGEGKFVSLVEKNTIENYISYKLLEMNNTLESLE